MLGPELEKTLRRALLYANERQHEYSTIEHLLLALLDDPEARDALLACGVDIEQLRSKLTQFLDHELALLANEGNVDAHPTAGFQRIVQGAAIHVKSSGRTTVNGANILIALFSERESHAVYFLREQGLSRLDVVNFISRGVTNNKTQINNEVDVSILFKLIERSSQSGIPFVIQTAGERATLEELRKLLKLSDWMSIGVGGYLSLSCAL